MEVISKDKPKGKAYSINKKMKKAKRLEEKKSLEDLLKIKEKMQKIEKRER